MPQISDTKTQLNGYTVQGGGKFHLGQLAYHSGKAYKGMLAGFNIWTKQLSPRTVAALAQEPGTESGDALAWHILKTGIMGNVEIYHNYDFQLKGLSRKKDLKQLQRQRK